MLEQRRRKRAHNPLVDLPENCIFDILVRLPVETLCSWRFVCKSWYEIISSPDFSYAHLHRSDTTTAARGFICFDQKVENDSSPPRKVFSVESKSMLADLGYSFHIKFMEIKDGKSTIKEYNASFNGNIVATCNGLIVLKNYHRRTRLIILNPVTRELEDIPWGTSRLRDESYGLAFCHVSRRYKLLHLFTKLCGEKGKLGCEILDIGSGTWRAADVPPMKRRFNFLEKPIFGLGALHWIQYVDDDDECMVSMPLDDEKFKTMAIPDAGGDYFYSKSVFAMGEFLGFSGRLERGSHKIGVWVLRGLGGEYGWEKHCNIDIASGLGHKPTAFLNYCSGEFVFKWGDGWMHAYHDHRHSRPLRKVETTDKWASTIYYRRYFPHVNSLVSWRS